MTTLQTFWGEQAHSFVWEKPWSAVLTGDFALGTSRWFTGASLNITVNCLDRHLPKHGNTIALRWEPNEPDAVALSYTYRELYEQVSRMANVLKKFGVVKGERVCIYLPMIPEAVISMLACARIGAVHTVVFAGFSSEALASRIRDCGCRIVITSDVGFRGKKNIDMKALVGEALKSCAGVERVLVARRPGKNSSSNTRDVALDDELRNASPVSAPELVAAEDPLFILYTSGSTGKPKGIVHGTAGYMVYVGSSFKTVFGCKPGEVFWCTADMGWITGHSYGVYGPLLAGATTVLFEGIPTYPTPRRYWEIIEKYNVSVFYTSPTAIRALESYGLDYVKNYHLRSLRTLGSVGEPLNVEAWHWYHTHVGKGRCQIVDTWWQTETGGIMISPQRDLVGKPGSVGLPLPGIKPALFDTASNKQSKPGELGFLCIQQPWPGLALTILNDHAHFLKTYFSTFKDCYYSGDVARKDADGYYYIGGRIDDVMNVSGHRISSAEIESAINFHPDAVESSVVAFPHHIKGSSVYAFVILRNKRPDTEAVKKEIISLVEKMIGPFARPERIQIVRDLPKTKSGKIVRRILRALAAGEPHEHEDLTTLVDRNVIDEIKDGVILN